MMGAVYQVVCLLVTPELVNRSASGEHGNIMQKPDRQTANGDVPTTCLAVGA